MQKMWLACSVVLFFSTVGFSQEQTKSWSNESEASIVQVGGNATSESYSAKQKTSYKVEANVATITGRYLQTKSAGTETAKQWDAALRFERELSADWAVFVQHGAESDWYAGYVQRDNTDLGGKYYFTKNEIETFFTEAGFRTSKTISSPTNEVSTFNSGRLYLEYSKKVNESVSAKAWVEYLPNFTTSDAYLVNYEPSMSVMMSQIFSIKVAYLVKYHNRTVPANVNEKKEDTSFTTALVAKF